MLALGVVLLSKSVIESSSSPLETIVILAQSLIYIIPYALLLLINPAILVPVVVCVFLYVGSLIFFSQTPGEMKFLKVVFSVAVLAVLLNLVAFFGMAMSGLASQGAGA